LTNQRGRATIKIKSDLHRKKTDADHFSQINRRMLKMGERADRARALFLNGYNCSQAVVGAFSDLFGMEPETAMRFAEGLGGGIGRMRLTCGAVSAMALLAGLKVSTGKPGDLETRKEVYAKVREMAAAFQEKNGSITCSDLLGAARPKDDSAKPQERTAQYYQKRPCPDCVQDCAEIVEMYLLSET